MDALTENTLANYPPRFRQQYLRRLAGKKKKGGSILGAVAGFFTKLGLNWGLKAIKERIAAKKGGKIEPKDWIHFAAGPWGWLHLALRERDRKKYKEEQKKLKQSSGGMFCGYTRNGPTSYARKKMFEKKLNGGWISPRKRLREEIRKLKAAQTSAQAETITGSGDGIRWYI